MKYPSTLLALAIAAGAFFSALNSAPAQGTAFTYQGRLNNGGNSASGNYDLVFALYNDPSLGSQQGTAVTNGALAVTGGLFTAALDFGATPLSGQPLWLQILVRTNGNGAFATLLPRQQLTPTPYAIFANTASNLSGALPATQLSGTIANGNLPASPGFSGTVSASSFSGNGASLASLNANNLSGGTVPLARLSGLTSNQLDAVTWQQATNLNGGNAASLGGLSSSNFWRLGGNNVAAGQFIGSTNNQAVDFWVNGARGLRLEPTANDASHAGIVNVVGGAPVNFIAAGSIGSVIAGGGAANYNGAAYTNSVSADWAFLGGGQNNSIQQSAYNSFLGGGLQNSIQVNAYDSFLGGGNQNSLQPFAVYSFLGGGSQNSILFNAAYSFLGGGSLNTNGASYSVVPGGFRNYAGGQYSFAAGDNAQATNDGAFVWADSQGAPFGSTTANQFNVRANGGVRFVTSGAGVTVDGQAMLAGNNGGSLTNVNAASLGGLSSSNFWQLGGNNLTAGQFIGSLNNQAVELRVNGMRGMRLEPTTTDGSHSNIVNLVNGSSANFVALGVYGATISGGGAGNFFGASTNSVTGDFGTVGGGENNSSGQDATVSGGYLNTSSGQYATVGGGEANASRAQYATAGGGAGNQATNSYATVPGGRNNTAGGQSSFAAGFYAQAINNGAFVWADSQGTPFNSTANDQFLVRANGGVGINTNNPKATLDVNGSLRINSGTVFTNFQAGQSAMASGASSSYTNLTITFPKAFVTTPRIMATVNADPAWDVPDTFVVSVRKVSPTNCVVNILRVDSPSGWSQLLRVNWIAWE
jgi:hypothetical protein